MDLTKLRPNVGVVLIRSDGQVWLGRRTKTPPPHNWQFPQGGIDRGEAELDAAQRELREETGAVSVRFLDRTHDWLGYEFPPEHMGAKAARGWRGQKQLWFAFAFEGEDAEFDLAAHKDEIEFDAWRWADIDDALALVAPFKREVYRQVIDTFRPLTASMRRNAI